MRSARALLLEGAADLREAGVESATTAARVLLHFVLGERSPQDEVLSEEASHFRKLIAQHKSGKPVSKIVGCRDFWDQSFVVNEAVLDPRPDSETLVEAVFSTFSEDFSGRVLDFGVGSGCILETILVHRPLMTGVGIDISAEALAVAQMNARRLGVAERSAFVCSQWGDALSSRQRFDVIVSNPPYIATYELGRLQKSVALFDPHIALSGGEDGLASYKALAPHLRRLLVPNGSIFLEIGFGQQAAVKEIFKFFMHYASHRDLSGKVRVLHFTLYDPGREKC